MWDEFGFERNIFDTHPISGDAKGSRLLVGRDTELSAVVRRIKNMDNVTTLEGPNGVGKTSLVLVAAYQLAKETHSLQKSSILSLPEPFQFSTGESSLDLKRRVYSAIASYFMDHETELRTQLDIQFNLSPLRAWIEDPIFRSGGMTIASTGAQYQSAPNTSSGFDTHGFFDLVDRLLRTAFNDRGGVVCILDNLEILNTSQLARQRLEELRDDLFSKHGIKWVVCGARKIVRSVASTPRLQGRLQEPLEITPLQEQAIDKLISSRVSEFSICDEATPPVGTRSFRHAFEILNKNLRDALKFSGDFCLWLADRDYYKKSADEYHELFEIWLGEQADAYEQSLTVPPRSWRLFDEICDLGGSISPSDYQDFDFNSPQSMRGAVQKLEISDLVISETDETDHRRKTIAITAKGWLIRYKRNGYQT